MRHFHKKQQHSLFRAINVENLSNILKDSFISPIKRKIIGDSEKFPAENYPSVNFELKSFPGQKGFLAFPSKTDFLKLDQLKQTNTKSFFEKDSEISNQYKIGKENNLYLINIKRYNFQKILGKGLIQNPTIIRAPQFSRKAEQKILQSGGCPVKVSF